MKRIRTEAELPFRVALLDFEEPPLYQTISEKAQQMRQLGMSVHAIAKHLKIDDKTVKKALSWLTTD